MVWGKEEIKNHTKAAGFLNQIKKETFDYIKESNKITEYSVQQFILGKFKKLGLKTDKDPPIVGFNDNSSILHYFPKKNSKELKPGSVILIDIWARLNRKNSPFADITWMAYHGKKIPKDFLRAFSVVIKSRDVGINFIKDKLKLGRIPTGKEVDDVVVGVIINKGYEKNILHRTGHSLGTTSPHGIFGRISYKNKKPLFKNLGYTIEPGVYLKNKFGVRSEIDFFIGKDMKLVITTDVQKKLVKV